MSIAEPRVVCIGGGPAGLTAAYLLAKEGVSTVVLEADPDYVGGLAKTVRYKNFFFDIGGHRFFSKSEQIEDLWSEILPNDLLERPRLSRIYYRGKFFSYPLRAGEALFKLGPLECSLCLFSYLKSRLFPLENPRSFEDWIINQFGDRLYRIFFKTYTEKVWGMSCKELSADWAAQRIKGLSLASAIRNALFPPPSSSAKGQVIKTLIHSFRYPRRGPGMLWEAAAALIEKNGGKILLGHRVVGLEYQKENLPWTVVCRNPAGEIVRISAESVISSAPLREVVQMISPAPTSQHLAARLHYRDFLTVALMLKERQRFSDNWLYIHSPDVLVSRIQNFKSWSPEMVPDPDLCCYGLEYFAFEGDELWSLSDTQLIELGKAELVKLALAEDDEIIDGTVVRALKAYPVYDDDYSEIVGEIRREFEMSYPGLHLVGRNGMHKYNNQDHAMMTALLTVRNILAGRQLYDVWKVNQDAEYHEER